MFKIIHLKHLNAELSTELCFPQKKDMFRNMFDDWSYLGGKGKRKEAEGLSEFYTTGFRQPGQHSELCSPPFPSKTKKKGKQRVRPGPFSLSPQVLRAEAGKLEVQGLGT